MQQCNRRDFIKYISRKVNKFVYYVPQLLSRWRRYAWAAALSFRWNSQAPGTQLRIVEPEGVDNLGPEMLDQQIRLCLVTSDGHHLRGIGEPLGRKACRRPFQHAAHPFGVPDIVLRELAHDETAGRRRRNQPLMRQAVECQADRRARNSEPFDQPRFG